MAKKKEAVEETAPEGDMIMGKSLAQIREAYFKGKLKPLLDDLQAKQETTEEGINLLRAYLLSLEAEGSNLIGTLLDTFGGKIIGQVDELHPPTVGELYDDPTKKEEFDAWKTEVGENVARVKWILRTVANQAKTKAKVPAKDFMDFAHELSYLMGYCGEYRTYLEQKYRKRIIEFVDNPEYKCSRAEGEERAKITPEYRDYKNAETLMIQIDNIIMNCKKEYGDKSN